MKTHQKIVSKSIPLWVKLSIKTKILFGIKKYHEYLLSEIKISTNKQAEYKVLQKYKEFKELCVKHNITLWENLQDAKAHVNN